MYADTVAKFEIIDAVKSEGKRQLAGTEYASTDRHLPAGLHVYKSRKDKVFQSRCWKCQPGAHR